MGHQVAADIPATQEAVVDFLTRKSVIFEILGEEVHIPPVDEDAPDAFRVYVEFDTNYMRVEAVSMESDPSQMAGLTRALARLDESHHEVKWGWSLTDLCCVACRVMQATPPSMSDFRTAFRRVREEMRNHLPELERFRA